MRARTAGSRKRCTVTLPPAAASLEQAPQNFIGIDAVGFGVEIQQHAMAQDGNRERGDVLVRDVVAPASESARLGRQNDELRRADAGAVIDIFLDEVGRQAAIVPRGANQANNIGRERFRNRDHAHQLLKIENLLRVCDRCDLRDARGGGQIDDFHFVLGAEVIEQVLKRKRSSCASGSG